MTEEKKVVMTEEKDEKYYKDHEKYINQLKTNPLELYNSFTERINKFGINAEFPEFAPAVHKVRTMLHSEEINKKCIEGTTYYIIRKNLDIAILNITLSDSWYPYATTIHLLYNAILFFDLIERNDNKVDTGYYHSFRYLYYFDKIIYSAPKCFIFPTWFDLGATDILSMCGSGIYIVGLNFKTEHVDEFLQTPAEFFIHDINHIRRYSEANERRYIEYIKKENISHQEFYTIQRKCIDNVIKLINKSNRSVSYDIKQAMKIIFFEILHEEAEPPLNNVICELLTRESAANYETGFKDFVKTNQQIDKKALHTPAGSIIGFVRYKLWYGFYDDVNEPNYKVATLEARKIETIATAAKTILEVICNYKYSIEELIKLASDNQGLNPPIHTNIFKVQGDPYFYKINEDPKTFTGIRPQTETQAKINFSDIKYNPNKLDKSRAIPLNTEYNKYNVVASAGGHKSKSKRTKINNYLIKYNPYEYSIIKYKARKVMFIDAIKKRKPRCHKTS